MHVAVIGGGGTIGSTVAYDLVTGQHAVDVTLIDTDEDAAYGHATDIRHATRHVSHPTGRASRGRYGTIEHEPPGPDALSGADCIVVTASAPRVSGGAERGGRMTFLDRNLGMAEEVGGWLREVEPRALLCVTNPVDRITHRLWAESGWPREHVLGYSLSETARMADWIADHEGASPSDVSCPMLGEHGEHLVPAFSRATVEGRPLALTEDECRAALDFVRDAPYDVIAHRGPGDSSRWVTGRGVAGIVEALSSNDVDDPVCLSVPLDGEYGAEDVCLSVPLTLSPEGWSEIHEWELSDWERERMTAAAKAVRSSLER
ncbi:malate dehydrogenase [Natronorarus salvus]|uniref:malate dehydrogenase n=1 Tax=Natronorarus salvus TaxID=3117733 RepID=UPI002F266668